MVKPVEHSAASERSVDVGENGTAAEREAVGVSIALARRSVCAGGQHKRPQVPEHTRCSSSPVMREQDQFQALKRRAAAQSASTSYVTRRQKKQIQVARKYAALPSQVSREPTRVAPMHTLESSFWRCCHKTHSTQARAEPLPIATLIVGTGAPLGRTKAVGH